MMAGAHARPTRPTARRLESLRDELESLLLVKLNRLTSGSLTVITDNYHSRRLGTGQIAAITDDLMGVIFRQADPLFRQLHQAQRLQPARLQPERPARALPALRLLLYQRGI